MELVRLKLYKIVYQVAYKEKSEREELIEANSFAEAEKLVTEQYKGISEFKLKSINLWHINTYRKSIKTVNIEV